MSRRLAFLTSLTVIAVSTVAIRIAGLLSTRHIDFDEGVYGVSVLAMRSGALPFRDVFSSQGPLFLPVLWMFDTLGLRTFPAMRIGMVATALVFALGVFWIARRATGEDGLIASAIAAVVVGTASAGVAAAGPVHSDGPALACGVWGVAVALGAGPWRQMRPVVVGLMIGAGMALKSIFLLPMAIAVACLYVSRRDWRALGVFSGSAATLGVAVSLPWGLGNVWDQFVAFQLAAPRQRSPWTNVTDAATLMTTHDPIFLVFFAMAVGGAVAWAITRRRPPGHGSAQVAVLVWFLMSALLLTFGVELNRGFYRFLAFFIAPAMVGFAVVRPPRAALWGVAVASVLLLPIQLRGAPTFLTTQHLTGQEQEVVAQLETLPQGTRVIADEPGLAWVAGRHPPPHLVDTSFARMRAGYLTAADVVAGAAAEDVCAVLSQSNRFAELDPLLASRLDGFVPVAEWDDDRWLYVKQSCL